MEVQVGEQVTKQRVGARPSAKVSAPALATLARRGQLLTHRVGPAHPPFGREVQQHLFMGGEVAAHRRVVNAGATGDCGQLHRRNTGLECQRARGLDQRRRTLALFSSVRARGT